MSADFDNAAEAYDREFTYSKIGQVQRKRVWDYILKLKAKHSIRNVLELNCGTGEDAQFLTRLGYRVLATDISDAMLNIAKAKSKQNKLEVTFSQLDLRQPSLDKKTKFDLVFSNFGGLNCIDYKQLAFISTWLNEHLNDKAHIVLVIMPTKSIIDNWYRVVNRQATISKTREKDKVLAVNVDGQTIKTYYFGPNDVATVFKGFDIVKIKSIGYVPSFLNNSKLLFPLLLIDKILYLLNYRPNKSDHFLIHLQKIK